MDIRQLETFVQVVRQNSFSKAAEKLFLSQPTVSAQVGALEKELGVQLLVRLPREVRPTREGVDFLAYAQQILSLRDEALDCIQGNRHLHEGEIDIVASTVPAQNLLPRAAAAFRREYPNLRIHVNQASSHEAALRMCSYQYDIGVVGVGTHHPRLTSEPLCDDTLVAVLPGNMPWQPGEGRQWLINLLREQPFIMREAGSGTQEETSALLADLGLSMSDLQPAGFFDNTWSIVNAVANGLGVAIVSRFAVTGWESSGLIRSVEIDSAFAYRHFCLLTLKGQELSPVLAAFVQTLRQVCRTYNPRS